MHCGSVELEKTSSCSQIRLQLLLCLEKFATFVEDVWVLRWNSMNMRKGCCHHSPTLCSRQSLWKMCSRQSSWKMCSRQSLWKMWELCRCRNSICVIVCNLWFYLKAFYNLDNIFDHVLANFIIFKTCLHLLSWPSSTWDGMAMINCLCLKRDEKHTFRFGIMSLTLWIDIVLHKFTLCKDWTSYHICWSWAIKIFCLNECLTIAKIIFTMMHI